MAVPSALVIGGRGIGGLRKVKNGVVGWLGGLFEEFVGQCVVFGAGFETHLQERRFR